MNKDEARRVLARILGEYRARTYRDLLYLLDAPATSEVVAGSGATYQSEGQVVWDGAAGANLRVRGSIDDGGLRAFMPLTEDFIIGRDGNIVGE